MPCSAERQLESGCSRDVLNLLYLLPSGLIKRNGRDFSKLIAVQSWTRAQTEGDFFTLSCALRAALDRGLLGMRRRAEMLSSLYGFEMKASEPIPAWEFREDSRLCAVLREVFREVRGKELGTEEVQGGLECSIFMQCDPDMDIIAMGPVGENVHTTAERLDLMSFDAIYNVFTVFLAKL